MVRSPLIDLVHRAYKVAHLSNKSGLPPNELIERLDQKVSRRRLLYGGLAVASAITVTALDSWKDSSAAMATISPVLVVGAGIAGLTAAYRLTQTGVPVSIIEARNHIGGRIQSLSNAAGTFTIVELGGEFIDSDHTAMLNLVNELGLKTGDLVASASGLVTNTWYFEGRSVPLAEIVTAFKPLAQQIEKDVASTGNIISYKSYNQAAQTLDNTSISDYLNRYCQNSTLQQLIRIAYVAENGREVDEQSCLNLLLLIGTGTTIDTFSIYGQSDQRYQVIGGNQQVPQRLAERLAGRIETGTVLESIRTLPDGRYRVSLRADNRTFDRTYERILLTLPFSTLRTVRLAVDLPPVKRRAIKQLGYGTNAKLITAYQERIWRTHYRSTASVYSDLGFQNTWESTPFAPVTSGLITDFTGGRKGLSLGKNTPEAQAQILLPQLNKISPGISALRQGRAIRAYWPGEVYTRGSYSCLLVGQYTTIVGSQAERVGNLFFAGEHCSLSAPGYMQGGCETGEAAAQEILQDLGVATRTYKRFDPKLSHF